VLNILHFGRLYKKDSWRCIADVNTLTAL